MAEWGYISFKELCEISVHGVEIDCEFEEHFPIRKAKEIENICKGNRWEYIQEPAIESEPLIKVGLI